jgi:phenylacetate-CoA ligase
MDIIAAQAKRFFDTLLKTERLPRADLDAYQAGLLSKLLGHARRTTPFYAERIPEDLAPGSEAWSRLPTLERTDLVQRRDELESRAIPPGFGTVRHAPTGGSTGTSQAILLTDLESMGRVVATYRMFHAHGLDPKLPLFMIRRPQHGSGRSDSLVFRKWAYPWLDESDLGDRIHVDLATPAREQLSIIDARAPAYVNTLPSNTLRIALEAGRDAARPKVPALVSVAELLPPETRRLAEVVFGSRVINVLSSAEGGIVAVECPQEGRFHLQSELVRVEVLDADGRSCRPGERGELTVTPLYNYAMPLIRYRSGDFAVAGGPCRCGRSTPTLERFVGRRQHIFTLRGLPSDVPPIDRVVISRALGHTFWQVVQTGPSSVVLRHEAPKPDTAGLDEAMTHLRGVFGDGVTMGSEWRDRIPLTSGLKFHHCINDTV